MTLEVALSLVAQSEKAATTEFKRNLVKVASEKNLAGANFADMMHETA